jgi:hypothetical protein
MGYLGAKDRFPYAAKRHVELTHDDTVGAVAYQAMSGVNSAEYDIRQAISRMRIQLDEAEHRLNSGQALDPHGNGVVSEAVDLKVAMSNLKTHWDFLVDVLSEDEVRAATNAGKAKPNDGSVADGRGGWVPQS